MNPTRPKKHLIRSLSFRRRWYRRNEIRMHGDHRVNFLDIEVEEREGQRKHDQADHLRTQFQTAGRHFLCKWAGFGNIRRRRVAACSGVWTRKKSSAYGGPFTEPSVVRHIKRDMAGACRNVCGRGQNAAFPKSGGMRAGRGTTESGARRAEVCFSGTEESRRPEGRRRKYR
jgi:hypothetical protein